MHALTVHCACAAYTAAMDHVRDNLMAHVNAKVFGGRPLSGRLIADMLPKLVLSVNDVRVSSSVRPLPHAHGGLKPPHPPTCGVRQPVC